MERIYKINYYKAPGTYALVFSVVIEVGTFFAIVCSPYRPWAALPIIVLFMSVVQLMGWYFLNVKITVRDDGVYIKKMDKLEVAKWNEIRKVERLLAIGAYRFIVRKKPRGFIEFWDYVDGYEEILTEIKKRTGLEVKWGL